MKLPIVVTSDPLKRLRRVQVWYLQGWMVFERVVLIILLLPSAWCQQVSLGSPASRSPGSNSVSKTLQERENHPLTTVAVEELFAVLFSCWWGVLLVGFRGMFCLSSPFRVDDQHEGLTKIHSQLPWSKVFASPLTTVLFW